MYCENCQREVASTKNPHTGLLQCSHCGTEKRSNFSDANSSIAETAHALLKRWEQSRGQNEEQPPAPRQKQPLSVDDALAAQPSLPESSRSSRQSGIDITAELLENADSIQAELESSQQYAGRSANREQLEEPFAESVPARAEQKKPQASFSSAGNYSAKDLADTYAMQKENSSRRSEPERPAASAYAEQPRAARSASAESVSKQDSKAPTSRPTDSAAASVRSDYRESESPSFDAESSSYKDALLKSLQPSADEQIDSFVPERFSQEAKAEAESHKPEAKSQPAAPKASKPPLDIPETIIAKQQKLDAAKETGKSTAAAAGSTASQKPAGSPPAPKQPKAPTRQGQVRFAPPAGHDTDFDVQQAIERHHRKQRNWSAIIGQLLALCGAVCMTGGIAIVIGNRFGSLEVAETTGWLSMAGGHLLFILGIYTHLTSRVEQIWQDVHQRSDDLARILLQQQRSQQMLYRAASAPADTDDEYGMNDNSFERQSLTRSA
ncbi:hypothetical protein GYB59_14605 [bacterium]|nr:hypothetical protein [bacterium]